MKNSPPKWYKPISRINIRSLTCFLVLLLLVASERAVAQTTLPSGIGPERLEERFTPELAPPPPPVLDAEAKTPSTVTPAGADETPFPLSEIEIIGQTVYKSDDVGSQLSGSGERAFTLGDAYRIANQLTQRYWKDGYVLAEVKLESYDTATGKLLYKVNEGHIAEFRVDDSRGAPKGLIKAVAKHVREINPFHMPSLERYLLLLNDLYGVKASVLIDPGSSPGAVNLTLVVRDQDPSEKSWNARVDNMGSRYLGPFQLGLTKTLGGMVTDHDRIAISAFTSVPMKEVRYLSANYTHPLSSEGTELSVIASVGATNPGYTLRAREVEGESMSLTAQLSHDIIRARKERLRISARLSATEVQTDVLNVLVAEDHIRSVGVDAQYYIADGMGSSLSTTIGVTQGLPVLGASEAGDRNLSRADGKGDFTLVNGTAAASSPIGVNFSGLASLSGQYAFDSLLSSEEFGFGGQTFGRGYDPSEFTGDHGISAAFELRYLNLPDYTPWILQPYAFYDIGKVWDIGGEAATGASAGFGVRFEYDEDVSGNLYLAQPLTSPIGDPPFGNGKSPRILFSISRAF